MSYDPAKQYARVVLNVQPGVAVVGPAVSDVVHLLAELIENATIFSPKDSPVQVSAQELTSGGVLIEVTDKGIGVSESRLAEMNWRLDNPPVMDVSVSRHMGLFAVARLAERHRIVAAACRAERQLPCRAEWRLPAVQAFLRRAQHRRRRHGPAQLRQAQRRAGRRLHGHAGRYRRA